MEFYEQNASKSAINMKSLDRCLHNIQDLAVAAHASLLPNVSYVWLTFFAMTSGSTARQRILQLVICNPEKGRQAQPAACLLYPRH